MNSDIISHDDVLECRVCRGPSCEDEPLYSPCLCRGSIKWVHQVCLQDWLQHRPRSDANCELCKYSFSFTPIYAPDAPAKLSNCQIVCDLVVRICTTLPFAFRVFMISNMWIILIPLLTRAMLRACFRMQSSWLLSPRQFFSILPSPLNNVAILKDFQSGILLCSVIFITVSVISVFRELIPVDNPDIQAQHGPIVNPNFQALVAFAEDHARPPIADINEVDPAVFNEDMPLSHWLGFSGHWTIFVAHFCSVLLANFLVLFAAVFCPLRVGKFFLKHVSHASPAELVIAAMDFADVAHQHIRSTNFFSGETRLSIINLFSSGSEFEDCATIAIGCAYITLLVMFIIVAASTWGNTWTASIANSMCSLLYQCLICMKVSVFLAIELLICPIVFGMAIDLMTTDIRHVTVHARYAAFLASPFLSTILYWITGIALFLQLSVFASALRQTLRRDVFLILFRDPEDPDFHPIQELIDRPVVRLLRSLVISMVIYLAFLVLCLHIPSRMALRAMPSLAPLNLRFSDATDGMPADLVFLHFCLPFAIQRIQMGRWHIKFAEIWLRFTCHLCSLTEAILPPPPGVTQREPVPLPPHMALRVFALLLIGWITYLAIGCVCVLMPLLTGRAILSAVTYHDMYAYLVGCNFFLVVAWAIEQAYGVVIRRDLNRFIAFVAKWTVFSGKVLCISISGGLLLPLLVGMLFDFVVIIPLRVPVNESAIVFVAQDWAMGLVTLKISCRLLHIGLFPSPIWKRKIEQLEEMGANHLDVVWVLQEIIWPLLIIVSAHLAIPYSFSRGVYPLFDSNVLNQERLFRSSFSILLGARLFFFLIQMLTQWFSDLQKVLFNDRYLVGQRLVNHELNE